MKRLFITALLIAAYAAAYAANDRNFVAERYDGLNGNSLYAPITGLTVVGSETSENSILLGFGDSKPRYGEERSDSIGQGGLFRTLSDRGLFLYFRTKF